MSKDNKFSLGFVFWVLIGICLLVFVIYLNVRAEDNARKENHQKYVKFLGNLNYVKIADVHIVREEHRNGKTTSFTDEMYIIIEGKNGDRRSLKKSNISGALPVKGEFWSVEPENEFREIKLVSKIDR
jgi:hypothetical protein